MVSYRYRCRLTILILLTFGYRLAILILLTFAVCTTRFLHIRLGREVLPPIQPDYNNISRKEPTVDKLSNVVPPDNTRVRTGPSTESLHQRQNQLQFSVDSFCRDKYRSPRPGTPNLHYFLVDEKRNILMCYIPKVACTVWQVAFSILTGKRTLEEFRQFQTELSQKPLPPGRPAPNPGAFIHKSSWAKLNRLAQYTEHQQAVMLQRYYKFMFVRDPFERLVSTYKDKFIKNFHIFRRLPAIKPYITEAQYNSKNLSFVEFMTILEHHFLNNVQPDRHWTKYIDVCNPCEVEYDFIGTVEHFEEDSDHILHEVFHSTYNASTLLKSSFGPSDYRSAGIKSHEHNSYESYYKSVPPPLLDNVRKYVEEDSLLFGYDPWRDFPVA